MQTDHNQFVDLLLISLATYIWLRFIVTLVGLLILLLIIGCDE